MGYLVDTDELVSNVKRDMYAPIPQDTFSPQAILSIADDILYMDIFPLLKSFNEGFMLESVDSNFVAGQAAYDLPKYAMWNAVYLVQRTRDGNAVFPDYTRIEISQLMAYQVTQQGIPWAYYLLDNTVNFVPTPKDALTDAYRLWIYRRPGRMVPTSNAAKVLSVDKVTGIVTYSGTIPSTYTASSTHDFYSITSPFRRLATNITATGRAGATQTFPVPSVQSLNPGDWVCLLDETVIPPISMELVGFLSDLVIKSLARTQGDYESYNIQKQEVMEKIKAAMIVPGNRTVGKSKQITLSQHPLARNFSKRYW